VLTSESMSRAARHIAQAIQKPSVYACIFFGLIANMAM